MYEYEEIAAYYDIMYADRHQDIDFYCDMAKEIGGPVLECGCGTARILLPIAQAGLEISGIDISEAMLKLAQKKLRKLSKALVSKVTLSRQDMRTFKLNRTFRLCIVPFRAFLHLLTPEDQDQALTQIHRHLDQSGILVMDIFAPSYGLLSKNTATIRLEQKVNPETGRKFTILDDVRYEHAKQLLHVERYYEESDDKGMAHRKVMPFTLRYVFRYEMEARLEKNGFQVREVYGTFDRKPYDYESGEMIFVAQKAS